MDSNQSGAVGGIIWGPFQGSLTHLGASRGLQSQKRGPFWAIFWPSLNPPCQPGQIFWSKIACTGVPHIELHVSCCTRTSGGYFRPSEVRFRGILALLSNKFYNVDTQKTFYLLRPSAPNFKTYIFGIVLQFPTTWLEKKWWVFFSRLDGSSGPMWMLHIWEISWTLWNTRNHWWGLAVYTLPEKYMSP